jgi:hypothetical protein
MDRRAFVLLAGVVGCAGLVPAQQTPLPIVVGGRKVTNLYWDEEWDKPFLYPIQTVSGKVLSRGWPIEPRDGDSTDHTWHRGIWYGHGDISGVDLWREQGREKTGRLIARSAPKVQPSGVSIDLDIVPPSGKAMGSIQEGYRFTDLGQLRFVDATITVHANAGQALTFGDTDDGGFGIRLSEVFREDRGATLRNSDGMTGTKNIWGKPAKWVDYSAKVDGEPAGVAMFDHPKNLRYPTRWHARGYSLNSANPFALKSFTKDAVADGRYTLDPGWKLVLRYRVVIYEGTPDLERLHAEYAKR